MLRIDVLAGDSAETVLRLEGLLADADVLLLEGEVESRLRAGACLALDLGGVRFIDRAGLDMLERWAGEGVALRGGSLFVRTQLGARGL